MVRKKTSPVYQTGQTSWNMCVTIQCLHSKSIVVRNWIHVSYPKPFELTSFPMMSFLPSSTGFNHQKTVVKHQHQWIEPTNLWNYKCCMIGFCLSITTTTDRVTLTKIHNLVFSSWNLFGSLFLLSYMILMVRSFNFISNLGSVPVVQSQF